MGYYEKEFLRKFVVKNIGLLTRFINGVLFSFKTGIGTTIKTFENIAIVISTQTYIRDKEKVVVNHLVCMKMRYLNILKLHKLCVVMKNRLSQEQQPLGIHIFRYISI